MDNIRMDSNTSCQVNYANKLKPYALGLALGVLWGISLFVMAILAGMFEWGGLFIQYMASVYVGYSTSFAGALIGLLWGLIDGIIAGVILAHLYNLFCGCPKCCCFRCKCSK